MQTLTGNALVGQSGGPTAVINQSLIGVVQGARRSPLITNVYGARHGIKGILDGSIINFGVETDENLELVAGTPSAALGSVRKKPTEEDCRKILEVFQALDVRYFFYIGGNDSAETAHILNQEAMKQNFDVRLFHVPKTIDNDLCETDHCPGFASAAKYVAQAVMGDNLDNESLPGIKLDVIMGRNVGWLTAASVLARRFEGDGPHLIYVPEHGPIDPNEFITDIRASLDRTGRCVITMSEGMRGPGGDYLMHELVAQYIKGAGNGGQKETDDHGNVQLSGVGALGDMIVTFVKQELADHAGLRVRADTFGYPQRCFAGLVSDVDAREAREVGRYAVEVATAGEVKHGSIVIKRKPGATYESYPEVAELVKLAQQTRKMDPGFLKGHNDIDDSYLDYLRPLVGPLPELGRLNREIIPEARSIAPA